MVEMKESQYIGKKVILYDTFGITTTTITGAYDTPKGEDRFDTDKGVKLRFNRCKKSETFHYSGKKKIESDLLGIEFVAWGIYDYSEDKYKELVAKVKKAIYIKAKEMYHTAWKKRIQAELDAKVKKAMLTAMQKGICSQCKNNEYCAEHTNKLDKLVSGVRYRQMSYDGYRCESFELNKEIYKPTAEDIKKSIKEMKGE